MDAKFFGEKSKKLCGPAWFHSKASKILMFGGAANSVAEALCLDPTTQTSYYVTRVSRRTPASTQVASQYVTRRPSTERELIVRTPISTSISTSAFTSTILSKMTCPKCVKFAKSGQVSCCAPGGAWYKNCGGAVNKNVDHRWSEGAQACKCKSELMTYSNPPWNQCM